MGKAGRTEIEIEYEKVKGILEKREEEMSLVKLKGKLNASDQRVLGMFGLLFQNGYKLSEVAWLVNSGQTHFTDMALAWHIVKRRQVKKAL